MEPRIRVIPLLLLNGTRLVKSRNFESFRDVGDPVRSALVYADQRADELMLLNVNRGQRSVNDLKAILEKVVAEAFTPISAGGGVRKLRDAQQLISAGADKVVVNSMSYSSPDLLAAISSSFGSQALVGAVDCRRDDNGRWSLWADCGTSRQNLSLERHVKILQDCGVGEILVQSVDRDGTMTGLDLELVSHLVSLSRVPVIIAGGVGSYSHLDQAFGLAEVSAVACGSIFNFTDSNPIRARAYLANRGRNVRKS